MPFSAFINGSVPTVLLYIQLGIVVALSLALLALVVRRLRGESHDSQLVDEEAWLHEVLAERHAQQDVIAEENRTLREKLRFLEAKILEYEILQEQLGSLPQLRSENEWMRAEIERLRRRLDKEVNQNVMKA